jgi:hypothetical protein
VDTNRRIAQLTSTDEEVREEARELLSLQMDDEIARAFLDIGASDADEEIRADVIIGLGPIIEEAGMDYGDDDEFELAPEYGPGITRETFESIVREVRALYEDEAQPKIVRRRAFEVLVRDPQPWQADAIRKHYAGDDPQWKLTAVFGMGYLTGFDAEIAATVASASDAVLYEAVRAAGAMDVTAAAARIRELATSTSAETDLRVASIQALPNVDPDCFELLQQLSTSDDEEIAETAQATLAELSAAEALADYDEETGEEDFE